MTIRIGIGRWEVVAPWLGRERVVYSSTDVFDCIRFRDAARAEAHPSDRIRTLIYDRAAKGLWK